MDCVTLDKVLRKVSLDKDNHLPQNFSSLFFQTQLARIEGLWYEFDAILEFTVLMSYSIGTKAFGIIILLFFNSLFIPLQITVSNVLSPLKESQRKQAVSYSITSI